MLIKNASIEDVLGSVYWRDTIVVLPTLGHAIHYWGILRDAMGARYGQWGRLIFTKTTIVFGRRSKVLRLWVPYGRHPEMPMDWQIYRRGFDQVDLYRTMGLRREL
jgi:hypothetical protein